jgi:hypothetical protein
VINISESDIHILSVLYLRYTELRRSRQESKIILKEILNVKFEVFTAVTMKNFVFWDIKPQFVLHWLLTQRSGFDSRRYQIF